jgi:hypothetical protein
MATIALGLVIMEGTAANRPAAGSLGRLYFATDTLHIFYDNGTSWDDVTPNSAISSVSAVALAPSAPGDFTVVHGLAGAPAAVVIQMTSGGQIWLQSPTGYDGTNIYAIASDAGVTATAFCFHN